MNPRSQTMVADEPYFRRPNPNPDLAAKQNTPIVGLGRTTRRMDVPADQAAREAVALVRAFVERKSIEGMGPVRGMARQMAMCALLMEREDPMGLDQCLVRTMRVFREAETTTQAALKKSASEARAILRYGVADAPQTLVAHQGEDVERFLSSIDEMLLSIRPREVLDRRAQHLAGQRGGRPAIAAFRVLSAVARLKASAGSGDTKAKAELRLLRTFLLDE